MATTDDATASLSDNAMANNLSNEMQKTMCKQVGDRYAIPWLDAAQLGIFDILKFAFSRRGHAIPSAKQLDVDMPLMKPTFAKSCPTNGIRTTWLGHATVVAQFDNVTVITDPIFSNRCSPSQWFGPKRFRDAPCSVDDLPDTLDAVVISHNHYDHLDLNSVVELNKRYGDKLHWFVPMGLKSWMEDTGCSNVVELEWWQESQIPEKPNVKFVLTPSQHWCKRTLTDYNKALWGSWCVVGPKYRFFFAGDTGYNKVFKEIGHFYGPFTVAAIPIGAYEPQWLMDRSHVDPHGAVCIHEDVKSQFSVGIHWGTFALANEDVMEPPLKLKEALQMKNIPLDKFLAFRHGESQTIGHDGHIEQ